MAKRSRVSVYSLLLVFPLVSQLGAQEEGSFRVDPKSGKVVARSPDFSHPDSARVLALVIKDWMTNPEVKEFAYGYLIDPDDDTGNKPPKLKALLIDKRYCPKKFAPKIPGVKVEMFDRSKRSLKFAEMCIRVDKFAVKKDGGIQIEFVHTGYGFIGGAWVTYTAEKKPDKTTKKQWVVEFRKAFDP